VLVQKVLVLVSGGVDSTVCAALLTEAIGPDRIFAIHIDNGFMRLDESTKVKAALEKTGLKLRVIDASEIFYSGTTTITKGSQSHITKRLDETVDPEEKRKIVGDTFVHVAQREIELLGLKVEDVRTLLSII
jgi:GMP synthase (glutamine-hydrolysing)